MIVAHTYTMDDVYQLALKREERLKFQVFQSPSSQIRNTFSNQTTNKSLSTTNFQISNHVNGEGSNEQALNGPNTFANKGKTSMSIGDKKVCITPLYFKCGGHGHVVCPSKGLHFYVEELEFELKNYSKRRPQ